ncbi:MAG: hypothetical protein RL318_2809 [Fibrobacterota bacterium]|jgi:uncharacterized protein (TIGR02001 family)
MKKIALGFALAGAFATAASAQVTGHVDLYSSYVLRGLAVDAESDGPAVQWGLDYAHASGAYIGYWGSTLDYQVTVDNGESAQRSIENDIYAGYAGKAGEVGYDIGVTSYIYMPDAITPTMGFEPKLKVSAFGAYVQAQYNAKDVKYSNFGDTYLTTGYSYGFAGDVSLGATLGWYIYGGKGKYLPEPEVSQAFRHLTISASKKVAPNLVVGLDGIIGGKSAADTELGNAIVAHASVVF